MYMYLLYVMLCLSQSITTQDDSFWDRYWSDASLTAYDYFALISALDIRNLRDKASGNLTALCFKVHSHYTMCVPLPLRQTKVS